MKPKALATDQLERKLQENGPSLLSPRRDVAVSQGNQEPRMSGTGVLEGTRALEQNAADSQASLKPSR